jgi:hypothetical protein
VEASLEEKNMKYKGILVIIGMFGPEDHSALQGCTPDAKP